MFRNGWFRTIGVVSLLQSILVAPTVSAGYLDQVEYEYSISHISGDTYNSDTKNSQSIDVFSPFNFAVLLPATKRNQYWSLRAGWLTYSLDADAKDAIGQDVQEISIEGGYRKKTGFSRTLKFWVETGLGRTEAESSDRFTIYSDGYLNEKLDDVTNGYFYLFASATHYFEMTEFTDLGIGASLQYQVGNNDFRYLINGSIKF